MKSCFTAAATADGDGDDDGDCSLQCSRYFHDYSSAIRLLTPMLVFFLSIDVCFLRIEGTYLASGGSVTVFPGNNLQAAGCSGGVTQSVVTRTYALLQSPVLGLSNASPYPSPATTTVTAAGAAYICVATGMVPNCNIGGSCYNGTVRARTGRVGLGWINRWTEVLHIPFAAQAVWMEP